MKIEMFKSLVEKFGDEVVFVIDGEFCFGIGDNDLLFGNEGKELLRKLEEEVNKVDGVCWYVGLGDEVVNCVSVESLSDFDKVEGLEEFVLKYVGKNCYLVEEDYID